jgi:hypothetical protein
MSTITDDEIERELVIMDSIEFAIRLADVPDTLGNRYTMLKAIERYTVTQAFTSTSAAESRTNFKFLVTAHRMKNALADQIRSTGKK